MEEKIAFLVNIVLYVFDHRHDDRIWIVVSKKAAEKYQQSVWLSDQNVHEK